ncbi:uncharacterized protein LOC107307923 [Coturnix japonica]|uniref:uncharacterized protein LOC107307923 n=1 Tax=Coturnix japonica TaxID=93934 RepID=UPI0007770A1F|nr:uncharacterized protein LOC107307923 [Coturnix japonica]
MGIMVMFRNPILCHARRYQLTSLASSLQRRVPCWLWTRGSMGQLRERIAPRCCFLLFLLLFLVTPCHGRPRNVAWEALSPDYRVGDTYEADPMEGDLERLQDSRDLPVRRISGMRRFHQPQGYPRAVAPQIPYPRSQMDLDFGPEEYPKAAGGVRTAEHVEQKQGGYKSAFAVLAVLFFLMVLAALAYLAKRLLMKRQKKTMTFEAVMKNEDPAPAEKRQPVARITIEIQDVSGDSQSRRKGLVRCIFSPITALFRQSPQQSSKLDLCLHSGISGTSKKALTSGKEEKNAS